MVNEEVFASVIASVRNDGYEVNEALARTALAKVAASYRGNSIRFRTLFNCVLDDMGIVEKDAQRPYELVLGGYFNHRAVEKLKAKPELRKGPWMAQVLSVELNRVVFQVYPELKATVSVMPRAQRKSVLMMTDIKITSREVLSGSTFIGAETYRALMKQAIAILNARRVPVIA
jgi:hypothetical protein